MVAAPGLVTLTDRRGAPVRRGRIFILGFDGDQFAFRQQLDADGGGQRLVLATLVGRAHDRLAVGAPGGRVGSSRSGRVVLFQGSRSFGVSWLAQLTQRGLGADETGDRFGAALVQVERDLVVMAPGEKPARDPRSGYGFAFRSSGSGFDPWHQLGQVCLNPGAMCPTDLGL